MPKWVRLLFGKKITSFGLRHIQLHSKVLKLLILSNSESPHWLKWNNIKCVVYLLEEKMSQKVLNAVFGSLCTHLHKWHISMLPTATHWTSSFPKSKEMDWIYPLKNPNKKIQNTQILTKKYHGPEHSFRKVELHSYRATFSVWKIILKKKKKQALEKERGRQSWCNRENEMENSKTAAWAWISSASLHQHWRGLSKPR